MGEEMHSIFQCTTMTITPRVRPPELPQSARLPEIPGRRQQRSAQFPALVRNVPAKGPLVMLVRKAVELLLIGFCLGCFAVGPCCAFVEG
jgi:hypothetical protein